MSSNPGKPPTAPGSTPTPGAPRRRFGWWWIGVLLALLAINYWAGSRATQAQSRVRVPYSPYFLQQVSKGDVAEITSKGTAIQGTFTKAQSYQGAKATTRFETEIPAFADTEALSKLLEQKSVVVNAVAARHGRAVVGERARRLRPDDSVRRAAVPAAAARLGTCRTCSGRSAARGRAGTSRRATR